MDFEPWLRTHHYRESTIQQTLSDLNRLGTTGIRDQNVLQALRRYLAFANDQQIEDEYTEAARELGVTGLTRLPLEKQQARKQPAVSFEDADWKTLCAAVTNSTDPRDQVIWAMVTTALRVGDVLRVGSKSLELIARGEADVLYLEQKGGATRPLPLGIPEPWVALARGVLKGHARTIAGYVCPGNDNAEVRGGCAYHRVNRRIKALKRKHELTGRAHSHRIRRTIAVKSLESTDNVVAVQQMLGHVSINSTMKYIDERDLHATARLQRKLAGLED